MGFRTWLYKKTGIKLKQFEDPWLADFQNLEHKYQCLQEEYDSLKNEVQSMSWLKPISSQELINQECKTRNIRLEKFAYIANPSGIEENVQIGYMTYAQTNFKCQPNTVIGRYCSIADNVRIGAANHPTTWLSSNPFQYAYSEAEALKHPERYLKFNPYKKSCVVGNDVWIGAHAFILPGVTIGDGAIVAGGAIVTKDVPPYAIVGGAPSKIIRYRFDEPIIQELLNLKWWELPIEILYQNRVEFDNIQLAIDQIKKIKQDLVQQK